MDTTGEKKIHDPAPAKPKKEPAVSQRVKPDEVIHLPDLSGE